MIRDAFVKAPDYLAKRAATARSRSTGTRAGGARPGADGELPWCQHCHRADDIATALRLADEFGYRLVINHGTEAHLLADLLAERGIPVIIGPLFTSRSKVELRHRSLGNPGLLAAAGVELAITTDHPVVPDPLPPPGDAGGQGGAGPGGRAARHHRQPGPHHGPRRPARLPEPGKHADLCVWSGDPLDARSRVESAWIEGRQVYRTGPGSPSAF